MGKSDMLGIDSVLLWIAGFVGFCFGAIVVMTYTAIHEHYHSRRLLKRAEHGVDITLPTGGKRTLLLAPEAAAQ
jgi:hypothetical protein